MRKALIVASVYGFICSFEQNNIKLLQSLGYEITCASNMSQELGAFGDNGQIDNLEIKKAQVDFARSPFSTQNFRAYRQLSHLLHTQKFDVIHCHTPIGGIVSRLVARKYRKLGTKVLYTAHGFHFFKGAPLLNWLLYYPAEKLMSRFTDVLITINIEDYQLAQRKFVNQVEYIPGVGVDVGKFQQKTDANIVRKELGIPDNAIVMLSVGELNKNKNHQSVISALSKLKNDKVYYLIVGEGPERQNLESQILSLGLKGRVIMPGYRRDLVAVYDSADIFCLPSLREGLCVSLMEAMASSLPCLVSDIRGNRDLIIQDEGGCFFNAKNPKSLERSLEGILLSESRFTLMGQYNCSHIKSFSSKVVIDRMKQVYST